ncbi:inositol monophosphatase family protein, putative [Ichthyophthirius multifiliis]|uniref:Inositol monophosphatase family protein, putative n=1 Tax=Ichthyophthirius multifiliis TaxID=5932 RepID=G0QMQ0_ICHMU|nr:inositol monophosphatase family protein, putative [Ichthyophthirius multifiliis]EGR33506.1 inositol monophosphatase family protein, putative [Ichthyophthirius multifiliis]|eukprot:XP_004037492.1 inositol monophosphatase family protein, putative [Ichthyophthirius multifiliis]
MGKKNRSRSREHKNEKKHKKRSRSNSSQIIQNNQKKSFCSSSSSSPLRQNNYYSKKPYYSKENRIEKRQNLQLKVHFWDYSTDEETYNKNLEKYWKKQELEKLEIQKEQLKQEEEKRLRKLEKIQNQQSITSSSASNTSSSSESSKSSQFSSSSENEDEIEFESDNSFARQCREKLKGPKFQKPTQRNKKSEEIQQQQEENEEYQDDENYLETQRQNQNHQSQFVIGPMPLIISENKRDSNYGGTLLPGEGQAIAQYIDSGKRIPRRGEVGLSSEQISRYEELGYVMSGSRHKRMNAVRQMKEAKVYSIQEKKALAIYNYEQQIKKENKIIDQFKQVLNDKLTSTNKKK